ncbi:hypothetical protein TorRG33x02_346780, partial [Trema orientale]
TNPKYAKTCRTEAKKPSSKTVGTSSAGKFPTKTPMSKLTIPKQNLTDFKGKSVIEAAYEKAKNASDVECSDRVKNIPHEVKKFLTRVKFLLI